MKKTHPSEIILRVLGILLLVGGIVLEVIGLKSLFSGRIGTPGNLFWCAMVGTACLAFGGMMLMWSFRRIMVERAQKRQVEILKQVMELNKKNDE